MRAFLLSASLLAAGAAVAVLACGPSSPIGTPVSDTQYDDPDDPGGGGSSQGPADGGAADATSNLAVAVALPAGAPGIGFYALSYSATLNAVIAPGGRSGEVDLVTPGTLAVTSIPGFGSASGFDGGHADGPIAVDESGGFLFVADATAVKLDVVDPSSKTIVGSAPLASAPGTVRYVASTSEVWVTEPGASAIEVFTVTGSPPSVVHAANITLAGAPAGLVIDATNSVAYTNVAGKTEVVELTLRASTSEMNNQCTSGRGLALDSTRGFLFVACDDGKVSNLAVPGGKLLSSYVAAAGVEQIAFDPGTGRLFVPGGSESLVSILTAGPSGALTQVNAVATAAGAMCVAVDGKGVGYVCDPSHGQLLVVK